MHWPKEKLTRFEVARLIGARSLQVALGAPILVKIEKELEPMGIAKKEFSEKVFPITIKRKLPNGQETVIHIKKGIENWLIDHSGQV